MKQQTFAFQALRCHEPCKTVERSACQIAKFFYQIADDEGWNFEFDMSRCSGLHLLGAMPQPG